MTRWQTFRAAFAIAWQNLRLRWAERDHDGDLMRAIERAWYR